MKKIATVLILLTLTFAVNAQSKKSGIYLVIPKLKLDKVPLSSALEAIHRKSKDIDPAGKGINIVLQEKNEKILNRKITLDLDDIPVKDAIKYTIMGSGLLMSYKDNGNTVFISSKVSNQLVSKFYRVSSTLPSFVSPKNIKLATSQKKLKEFFISTGIQFPKGSSISFIPGKSTLSMNNTTTNHEKLVKTLASLGCLR